jgi:hypothetical protein
MKLIHKSTGQEVREGDIVESFRGESAIVIGWTKPHSPASTGRITVQSGRDEHTCYPSVYSCEWIEREDRQEENVKLLEQSPQIGDTKQLIYGFSQPSSDGGFGQKTSSQLHDEEVDSGLSVYHSMFQQAAEDKSFLPSVNSSDPIRSDTAEEKCQQIRYWLGYWSDMPHKAIEKIREII